MVLCFRLGATGACVIHAEALTTLLHHMAPQAFRYLESLRVMTDVLLSSIGSFIAISSLMVLFIFCWAVIGLQVCS